MVASSVASKSAREPPCLAAVHAVETDNRKKRPAAARQKKTAAATIETTTTRAQHTSIYKSNNRNNGKIRHRARIRRKAASGVQK